MSKAIITEQHLHDIADAIIAKGGATAPMTPAQMPEAIRSIPSGSDEWTPPQDYHFDEMKAVYDSLGDEYPNKIAVIVATQNGSVKKTNFTFYNECSKVIFSDGTEYTSSGSHVWGNGARIYEWCIFLSNNPIHHKSIISPFGVMFYGDENSDLSYLGDWDYYYSVRAIWVHKVKINNANSIRLSSLVVDQLISDNGAILNATDSRIGEIIKTSYGNQGFVIPQCLSKSPRINLQYTPTSYNRWFNGSRVTEVQDFDFSSVTDVNSMFENAAFLRKLPDVMDCRHVSGFSYTFHNLYSLERLPLYMTANASISFAQSSYLHDRDSVAIFDGDGNVVGGFVGNLKSWDAQNEQYVSSCPNSGQTITFNNGIKSMFTSDEWTAIKSALAAKNWGCSPA